MDTPITDVPRHHRWGHRLIGAGIVIFGLVLVVAGFAAFHSGNPVSTAIKQSGASVAEKAGLKLSGGKCEGKGPVTLTHAPMNPSDFSIYIPYGLMVGGHVTPIDHSYWAPAKYDSPRDAYPVYAMADGHITGIQTRSKPEGDEYRLVFTHTCTFLTYYDLVTSLSPELKLAYEKARGGGSSAGMNYAVKAGQQIGKIGHQTLDFAVWNTETPLKGFVNLDSYTGEDWKPYTADPYLYVTAELKKLMTERNPRVAEPIAGKIDYDVDGKLVGNWFVEGSGGYHSRENKAQNYWTGHLAIAPDLYDPSQWIISIGDWPNEQQMQHHIQGNGPDPRTIGMGSGLVKYELIRSHYVDAAGAPWSQMNVIKAPKVAPESGDAGGPEGTVLVQVLEGRKLKFESFPGKTAAQVSGFDAAAKIYVR